MKSSHSSRFSLRSLTLAAAVLVGGGFFAAALAQGGGGETALTAPAERKPVPDFVMPALDGKEWRLSAHKGRVLVVNLFATWCPPCRAEMPMLVETAAAYRAKGVDFVAVSLDRDGAKVVKPFVAKYKIDFPVLFPSGGPSIADGVTSIPVTLVIDRQGRLAQTYSGMVSEQELTRDLDRLAAEKN